MAFDPLGRYSVDPKYGGPEYESLAALGVNLGLEDLIAICKSNEMCNYLGDGHGVARLHAGVGHGVLRARPPHAARTRAACRSASATPTAW